ncbi:hypothetical protein HN827_09160 [archaeon]|jgi:hypothetical protein|nr:hypothetical protein [archaeon]MBT4646812.1 hypothetical protein [archaeon]MBT6821488.1 hypothetical protein [archaeon]MBT7392970.1 hypothetical protein [archaeon]
MNDRKLLFYAILSFLVLTTITNIIVIINIDVPQESKISGKATQLGNINLCLLDGPPDSLSLSTNCNTTIYEDDNILCNFSVNTSATYTSSFITNPTLFTIESDGNVNFTPNQTNVGNHSYSIGYTAGPSCSPRSGSESFDVEIINTKDPPILIQNFSNQKWPQDTSITPFDLDSYFSDPDGDELSYSYTPVSFVTVTINNLNEVTFKPAYHYYGIQYVYFSAMDPYNASVTSNKIKLTIQRVDIDEDDDNDDSTSSSSGGSGSSGSFTSCISQWFCSEWSQCPPTYIKHRTCTDEKNCTVPINKPNETESCVYEHTCYDGILGPYEEQVDCGGICPACETCFDGIKNQNEEEIDCGGICKSCTTTLLKPGVIKNIEKPIRITSEKRSIFNAFLMMLMGSMLIYALYRSAPVQLLLFPPAKRKKKKELILDVEAKQTLLERLAKLEKKIPRLKKEEIIIEFSSISREYFRRLFEIEYEYTYEELQNELKNIEAEKSLKELLVKFFKQSSEISYSGSINISKNKIIERIYQFRKIIELTSVKDPGIKKPETIEQKQKILEYKLDTFFLKVSNAKLAIKNNNINKAYKIYLELHKDYEKLKNNEKKRVVKYIENLYNDLYKIKNNS